MMFKMIAFATTLGLATGFTSPCGAQVNIGAPSPGFTYFHRAGATAAEHDRDLAECALVAGAVRSYSESYPLTPSGLGAIEALVSRGWTDAVHLAALENCMIVRGWQVVSLEDDEGRSLTQLPLEELSSRVVDMIGSPTASGIVVRRWDNDAAHAENNRYTMRPRGGATSLSLLASGVALVNQPEPAEAHVDDNEGWPSRSVQPAQLSSRPPGSAVVIFRIRGGGMRNGIGMTFMRVDPTTGAIVQDRGRNLLHVGVGTIGARREGNWLAFVVPPGKWRLATMGGIPTLSFCLGSPAFDAAEGEVIYGGTFDMAGTSLGPDLDVTPVQAWLAGQPGAATVRAASYTNGWTAPCGSNEVYAIEFDGTPFRAEYQWGSRAAEESEAR